MEDGVIVPLGIARSRAQAYQAMVDKVEERIGKSKVKIAYVHAGAKQEVEKIKKIIEEPHFEWVHSKCDPFLIF